MTSSGEPTFGVAQNTNVLVELEDGTLMAGFHDGDTWFEGSYDLVSSGECPKVQSELPPVRLVQN